MREKRGKVIKVEGERKARDPTQYIKAAKQPVSPQAPFIGHWGSASISHWGLAVCDWVVEWATHARVCACACVCLDVCVCVWKDSINNTWIGATGRDKESCWRWWETCRRRAASVLVCGCVCVRVMECKKASKRERRERGGKRGRDNKWGIHVG